jgi:hypothetical protein
MMRAKRIGIAIAGMLAVAACSPSEILEVDNPDIIDPAGLATPAGLAALYAGALGDFSLAVVGDNGGTEGQILVSGSFSDELGNSETFPTRKEYDQRGPIDARNGTLLAVFRSIQRARRAAELSAATIRDVVADPVVDARVGESFALEGTVYNYLGEHYCSGVPISTASADGTLTFGDPLTTTQLFNEALMRFDSAAKYPGPATSTTIANFAKVGKGRALLNLGQYAAAAAAVTGVPTSFRYNTTHTLALGRQQNGLFVFLSQTERFTVADLDGTNGLPFRTAMDPRVPWARTPANDVGFDNATPQYDQGKYASETAPVAIASGVEARLIEAEAVPGAHPAGRSRQHHRPGRPDVPGAGILALHERSPAGRPAASGAAVRPLGRCGVPGRGRQALHHQREQQGRGVRQRAEPADSVRRDQQPELHGLYRPQRVTAMRGEQ